MRNGGTLLATLLRCSVSVGHRCAFAGCAVCLLSLVINALRVGLGIFVFVFVGPYVTYWMYDEQWQKSESGITETTAAYHFLAFFVAGISVSEHQSR